MLLRAALEHFGTTVARNQKWDGKVECECSPGYALPLPYKWALIERVEASADNQRDLAGVADHGLAQLAQWAIHRADHQRTRLALHSLPPNQRRHNQATYCRRKEKSDRMPEPDVDYVVLRAIEGEREDPEAARGEAGQKACLLGRGRCTAAQPPNERSHDDRRSATDNREAHRPVRDGLVRKQILTLAKRKQKCSNRQKGDHCRRPHPSSVDGSNSRVAHCHHATGGGSRKQKV